MPSDDGSDDDSSSVAKKPQGGGRGSGGGGGGAGGGGKGKAIGAVAGPGLAPLYLSDAGLDLYSMKKGTRATDIVDFKILPKADIIKQIEEMKDQCDFFSLKEQIEEYEGDQLLLIRGPSNEFEYNYLWCSTTDSYEDHIQEVNERGAGQQGDKEKDLGGGGFEDGEDGDDDDEEGRGKRGKRNQFDKGDGGDGQEKAAVKRPVEAMTDIQIATLQVKSHRPPLGFYISQSRFKFCKPFDFDDVEPAEKLAEYRRSKIPHYTDEKLVLEMGFQAAPRRTEMATQTSWMNSVNKATQYAPASFSQAQRDEVMASPALAEFLRNVEALTVRELQMNETLDIFKDEFREFEDEEVSLGNRLENNLEVFHSFSHFKYSKNKNINAVQWMPTAPASGSSLSNGGLGGGAGGLGGSGGGGGGRGLGGAHGTLVAFSCSNNVTFDQWVEQSGKVLTSSILLYSLSDVLHPWLVLEVPGNIQCFKVHPTHPEFIAAGLATGQVIFWDLSDAREKVRMYQEQQRVNQHAYNRSGKGAAAANAAGGAAASAVAGSGGAANAASSGAGGAAGSNDAAGGESSDSGDDLSIPPIKYTVLSYIDRSHSRPVTDIVWIPASQQVSRKGDPYMAEKGISSQFASVASDGKLLLWDFKNKNDGAAAKISAAAASAAMGSGPSAASPTASALAARSAAEDPDAKEPRWAPIFSLALSRADNSGIVTAVKLALGEVGSSTLMAVTEDGEVVEIDWTTRPTEDRPRPDTIRCIQRAHFAAAASVERSPHFNDIFLTVGDWTFSIWKVGVDFPIFTSSCSADCLAAGRWSPTRPGIIVTARADGTIDVWDLVDQCHKCSLNFATGFSEGLSSLEFWQSKGSSQQYLATGDIGGKLHIIEVPRNLRRKIANEENLMRLFYEREIARSKYCRRRMEVRKTQVAKEAVGKNKSVSISAPDDPNGGGGGAAGAASASTAGTSASAAAAQQLKDDKASELAAKEKADKLRQQEEEKAEKEYQRLFDQFKSSLQPEDMRQEPQQAHGAASQMRK